MSAVLAAVINGALVSVLVTAAAWLGMLCASRRLNAATRYLVWWAVLAMVIVLPVFYLPAARATWVEFSAQPIVVSTAGPRESRAVGGPTLQVAPAAPSRRLHFPLTLNPGSLTRWVVALWAVTSLLMLARLAMSWTVLARRKARASEAPAALSAHLATWLAQCRSSRRKVRLAVSAEIPTPMAAGLRHPAILIPAPLLDSLDEGELDQIGLHETAHLARGDDRALLVQRVLEALFALHPVVRWIARRIDLEREIACDDFVVQATGLPRPYAACLTRVAELTGGVRSSIVAAAAADEHSHLTRRIDMLLDKSRDIATRPRKARLALVVAALAGLVAIAVRTPGAIAFAMPIPVEAPPAPQAPAPQAAIVEPVSQAPLTQQAPPRPAAPPANQATIAVTGVKVPLTVRDPHNRFVTGLEKENFRIFEEGVEQEIARFGATDIPLSVGLVVDTSGSMGTKFDQVQQAVRQFLEIASPNDKFFVVQFDDEARLALGFTGSAEVQQRIARMAPKGGTALFDAVQLALLQMAEAPNPRKAILVITDAGSDNSSTNSGRQLLRELQGNVPLYIMSLAAADEPPGGFLADLADQSGGRFFNVPDLAAMAGVASRIAVELRNAYVLEYTPRNPVRDGSYRRVRIDLVAPRGLPPLTVAHRQGYYAPRQ